MITPEEVKDELQHYVSEYGMDYYGENHFPVTTKYLLQQEKVSKLLELYKQYYNTIPIGTSMYKVELEIKALEEELK